jgi:NADH-quinone oxidoreductase subunit F
MSKNIRTLSAAHREATTLFEALTDAGADTGTPSAQDLTALAEETRISPASLLGASSFYDFLKADNRGKKAYVCSGTACLLSATQEKVRERLSQQFAADEIGEVACLGRCYHTGSYQIGRHCFDAQHEQGDAAEMGIPFYSHVEPSLFSATAIASQQAYATALIEAERIHEELTRAQLRGRGGAGFPFAMKLRACAEAPAGQKYIICNADEGDPGAFSDRYLLEQRPQQMLAGMLAAGVVSGADTGFIYIRAEYPQAVARLRTAVSEYEQLPIAQQTGFRFRVIKGAGAYICGEETALLNSIEGLRPEVRTRPPYPAQAGLYDCPTLVSNVETFAAVPWILHHGGEAFARLGTEQSRGSKLVSLDVRFQRPGVHEVEMGITLRQLIDEYGGGFTQPIKALQVGGPLGGVVPAHLFDSLRLDFEAFRAQDFELGHAGVIAIPESCSMLAFLQHLFGYMAAESCGKCLPCRLGTEKGRVMLDQASAEHPLDRQTFDDLLQMLELGSLCALGGGLPIPVRNILQHFADELQEYFH